MRHWLTGLDGSAMGPRAAPFSTAVLFRSVGGHSVKKSWCTISSEKFSRLAMSPHLVLPLNGFYMLVFRGLEHYPPDRKENVVAVGTFDGLHRGHQEVLHTTVTRAHQLGLTSLALTFDRHPLEV